MSMGARVARNVSLRRDPERFHVARTIAHLFGRKPSPTQPGAAFFIEPCAARVGF
jgi:hypothetical protein